MKSSLATMLLNVLSEGVLRQHSKPGPHRLGGILGPSPFQEVCLGTRLDDPYKVMRRVAPEGATFLAGEKPDENLGTCLYQLLTIELSRRG